MVARISSATWVVWALLAAVVLGLAVAPTPASAATTTTPAPTTTAFSTTPRTTKPAGTAKPTKESENSVVAIVIACVAVLIALVAVVLFVLVKRRRGAHPLHRPAALPQRDAEPFQLSATLPRSDLGLQLALDGQGFAPIHYAVVKGDSDALMQCLRSDGGSQFNHDYIVPSPGSESLPEGMKSPPRFTDVEDLLPTSAKLGMQQQNPLSLHDMASADTEQSADSSSMKSIANIQDRSGNTPLIWAVFLNSYPILSTLIRHGADVNVRNHKKQSAVHLACMQETDPNILRCILSQGANLLAVDCEGCTPLSYVCRSGNVAHFDILDEADVDVNHVDTRKMTPLMVAASRGHTALVERIFQKRSCLLNAKDITGWTALHWAVAVGEACTVRMMVANKRLSLCVQNARGETPLHIAAREGSLPIVELLLQGRQGSQAHSLIAARTEHGMSARDYATNQHHNDCAEYIATVEAAIEQGQGLQGGGGQQQPLVSLSAAQHLLPLPQQPPVSSSVISPPMSPLSELSSTGGFATSDGWLSEDFSSSVSDTGSQGPKHGKRGADGAVKTESGDTDSAHEAKKARHREYMRARRKDQRSQIERMEAKVAQLDMENQTLSQAIDELRREACTLRETVGDGEVVLPMDFSDSGAAVTAPVLLWSSEEAEC